MQSDLDIKAMDDDRIIIQRAYRNLLKCIKGTLSQEDQDNIRLAYEMAVKAHSAQRRKSGEPYILHPIAVAQICVEEIGLGPTAVICALLHDVVEDTDITLKEIEETFGERIAKIVDGLTKLDSAYNVDVPQAENFKKVLSTLVEDVRVVLIKMADRLHNMRTLGSMLKHKQLKIAAETTYIYAPLAHRLGLYNIKTEFQDLCMKITDPENYHEIARKLKETKKSRTNYIEDFIKPLKGELDDLNIPYRITGRPKSIYSIYNKIKTKKVSFEEIYDLFAIRIIVDVPIKKEKSACWQVYSVVTDVYSTIPERLKDWITTPKSNGYESLHTSVIGPGGRFVEVQIRSERMDEIAERGYAAHWKYKGMSNQHDVYESWLDSVRDLMENPEADALEFINDFKTNLFAEEVYIYTPKGDLQILPKGSSALDFAFSIHSDLGYHAVAIKVNNKLVPMGYKLKNGDQVHVTTNKSQKPNESWLKMVITGKARSKIRSALKEEKKKQAEFGKEAVERKLNNLKVDFESNIDTLIKYYGFKTRLDLYSAIASDEIKLSEFKNFKIENNKIVLITPVTEQGLVSHTVDNLELPKVEAKDTDKMKLLIGGESADHYDFSFATCCSPLPGDKVFAYLTSNAGLKIHRQSCANAPNLFANYGYRIMKAEWINISNKGFVAELVITGIDSGPGVIERLTQNISGKLGLNIRSFYIDGNEGYFEGRISIVVPSENYLVMAIKALKGLDGISSVYKAEA
ncbi:MAG TPA: RelA/SpoT family protein [Saprospiraceae bacterium]|nr:RelA/SpoT family protein [Saprospiraceae bacterium]MCC6688097.1 bifunctional (p)ppGpp synthetase/guanosine-3',5'-bis(diphosphate) 3'-pyrophosphohydrolase [Saprospiraceae bacterium]HMV22747.1 RelA/SpoT family protein [Saprospiraceae bacterium]HMW74021.1 RelA/SpoT family protein [Saprospiraceae bacterium]HMX84309.1 RelA/SpoT family protein [Saprospiraceae bacterium]